MDHSARIAFIHAQCVCAQAKIEGMKAENQRRISQGLAIAYDDEAFFNVEREFGIDHNSVIEYLRS